MADSWTQIGDLNFDQLESLAETAAGVLNTLANALDLLATALSVLSTFIFDDVNAIKAIIDAAVDTIENTIEDLLQNNVGAAVHVNMNWNPDWNWRRDWYNQVVGEETRPWAGTGLSGWLLDVAFSAEDPSDPYRPLTDEETEVTGVIFLKGVPANGEFDDLVKIYQAFTDFSDFEELFDESVFSDKADSRSALFRLGPAGMSDFMEEVAGIPNTLLGKVTRASGSDGETFSGSNKFLSSSTDFAVAGVVAGDELTISTGPNAGTYTVTSTTSLNEVFIATTLGSDSSGDDWEIVGKVNPDSTFLPVRGAYPKWISVPLASLLPPLREAFDILRQIADNLKIAAGKGEQLSQLADLLAKKAELLSEAADRLTGIIDTLVGIAEFFAESHTIYLTKEPGGFGNFINRAQFADNVPDFGSNGIVVGVVIVATADDPANHLEGFLEFVGLQVDTLTTNTTTRADSLADQYDELF